jgi:putative FmdB family regulatory protein
MPIYAYKCSSCGHAQDVIQKISDDPLTVCTACGSATFAKQITAAGFQLKGSGWYATDFRNNGNGAAKKKDGDSKPDGAADGKPAETKGGDAQPAAAACGSGGCAACS